jgi:hypothetical protein
MAKERKMNKDAYDDYAFGDDGWVHQELDDEDIALIKERRKERSRTVTLEELMDM